VVLRLLLDTGVRVSEVCGLELTDVDLDRELAYVLVKGAGPRVMPFGAKTAQAVDRYLRVRALPPYARTSRLLLGQHGPMTPAGARDVLHTRAAQAGVANVHPHRFRHTFAHRRQRPRAGPDDARRLAIGRHAVPVRRLNRSPAGPRRAPTS
jgi:site-specific recombinase XerD